MPGIRAGAPIVGTLSAAGSIPDHNDCIPGMDIDPP
jgi:hypothetical protein